MKCRFFLTLHGCATTKQPWRTDLCYWCSLSPVSGKACDASQEDKVVALSLGDELHGLGWVKKWLQHLTGWVSWILWMMWLVYWPGGNILKVGCLRFGNGDEVHRSGLDAGFTSHQRMLYPPLWNRLSSAMGQCWRDKELQSCCWSCLVVKNVTLVYFGVRYPIVIQKQYRYFLKFGDPSNPSWETPMFAPGLA